MKFRDNLDLKSLITLLLTLSIIGATFIGILAPKDALVPLTMMVFTYFFAKAQSTPTPVEPVQDTTLPQGACNGRQEE